MIDIDRYEGELWIVRTIRPGLINLKSFQESAGKLAFFSKNANIYQPLSVYNNIYTVDEWIDKCKIMFNDKLIESKNNKIFGSYVDLYKSYKSK